MSTLFPHILDNPIWHALHTGNKHVAFGNEQTKYIQRDIGLFAGLKSNHENELKELVAFIPGGGVILFVPAEIIIPVNWGIKVKRDILQMVYEGEPFADTNKTGIVKLKDEHIPDMIELTRLTNPGPFFTRTLDLGNYEGIFEGSKLIAMAGRRLQPDPYIEVSAVCTDPDHTGKGYAAKLVKSQVNSILEL